MTTVYSIALEQSNRIRKDINIIRIAGEALPIPRDHARAPNRIQIIHVDVFARATAHVFDAEDARLACFAVAGVRAGCALLAFAWLKIESGEMGIWDG